MIKKNLSKIIYLVVILLCGYFFYHSKITEVKNQQKYIEEFEKNEVSKAKDKPFSLALRPIGILYVPEINLIISVFDNASENSISKGAGLIRGTGTLKNEHDNSVLTSHNGDSGKDLFINVPKLKVNNKFYLKLIDKKIYEYNIINTVEVSPLDEEKNFLKPKDNETYVTLRTCTPIGINDKRFLATGNLIGEVDSIPKGKFTLSLYEKSLIFISLISILLIILNIRKDLKQYAKNS